MNISPPSSCAWINSVAAVLLLGALLSATPGPLPPFLEEFRASTEAIVVTELVAFPSAVGPVRGYLARPKKDEALPALVLLHEPGALTDFVKKSAREMAGIGYVVLAVDVAVPQPGVVATERTLAELTAAVRGLRRRPDVLPARLGVVGWSWGADQALALAANMPVQACVCCDGALAAAPELLAALRATPVLLVRAGGQDRLAAFRAALVKASVTQETRIYANTRPGFMVPAQPAFARAEAEEAWVAIYNFLGKYVEDADEHGPSFRPALPSAPPAVASIADLMRTVTAATGVRGDLVRALETPPADARQWRLIRARAALLAEAGALLEQRTPAKGGRGHWLEQARSFSAAARELVIAADERDYHGARQVLNALGERCAACHTVHR